MTAGADASSQPVPAGAEPKPNPWQRIAGVFFSPGETFESIARRPDFVVPLIVLCVISLLVGIVFAPRVDFGAPAREAMEEKGAPPEQIEQVSKMSNMFGKIISYTGPITTAIVLAVLAAIFLLAFRIMGGEGNYKQAFAITTYAWYIQTLRSVIMAIVLLIRGGLTGAQELETLVRSNPAFLVDMKSNPVLFSLLTNLDVFTLWWLFVTIIGFAAMSRFSKAKAAAIVICLWIVKVIGAAGVAAIGALGRKSA
jgi:hypothetical protein